jgi:hypothetical protein
MVKIWAALLAASLTEKRLPLFLQRLELRLATVRARRAAFHNLSRRDIYFDFAFCAAQRLRCASAIRLRASGLSKRFALPFALAGVFVAFDPFNFEVTPLPLVSKVRMWVRRAISASI